MSNWHNGVIKSVKLDECHSQNWRVGYENPTIPLGHDTPEKNVEVRG